MITKEELEALLEVEKSELSNAIEEENETEEAMDSMERRYYEGRVELIEQLLLTAKPDRYSEGVRDALSELSEVFGEGIEETDLWQQYMEEESND